MFGWRPLEDWLEAPKCLVGGPPTPGWGPPQGLIGSHPRPSGRLPASWVEAIMVWLETPEDWLYAFEATKAGDPGGLAENPPKAGLDFPKACLEVRKS